MIMLRREHEVPQRTRVVKRVVRHVAVLSGAEARAAQELERQAPDRRDLARPRHQQRAEIGDVVRPVGDDHRLGVSREVARNLSGGLRAGDRTRVEAGRHAAEIGDDVALDPAVRRFLELHHGVKFLIAELGHERQADQRAAEAVELGVKEIAHRGAPFGRAARHVQPSAASWCPSQEPQGRACGCAAMAINPVQWPALAEWKDVLVRTWKESGDDNVGLLAAGVAFYGFLAFVPLLASVVLTYGLVASAETVAQHIQTLARTLPRAAAAIIADQLQGVTSSKGSAKGFGLVL